VEVEVVEEEVLALVAAAAVEDVVVAVAAVVVAAVVVVAVEEAAEVPPGELTIIPLGMDSKLTIIFPAQAATEEVPAAVVQDELPRMAVDYTTLEVPGRPTLQVPGLPGA